jgi:hypothetical protein
MDEVERRLPWWPAHPLTGELRLVQRRERLAVRQLLLRADGAVHQLASGHATEVWPLPTHASGFKHGAALIAEDIKFTITRFLRMALGL